MSLPDRGTDRRITSGQRAMIAASLQSRAQIEPDAALYLADACAILLDGGWPDAARAVLAHLLDRDSVEQTWTALANDSQMPTLRAVNGDPPTHLRAVELSELPDWATYGLWSEPGGTGRRLFGREVLDLRAVSGRASPHFRVIALAAEQGRPSVCVEASEVGTPVVLDRDDARHVLVAMAEAVKITRQHRRWGQRR
jgi:hypothetical protein